MGSCYSCRSQEGRKYSSVMASLGKESPKTKRITPYCRGSMSTFGFKRHSPSSVKSLSKTNELVNHYESRIASLNDSSANNSRTTNASRNISGIQQQRSNIPRFGFKGNRTLTNTSLKADTNSNILSDTNTVRQRTTFADPKTNTKTSFENTRIAQQHSKRPVVEAAEHTTSKVNNDSKKGKSVSEVGKNSRVLQIPVRTSETSKGSPKRFADRLPRKVDTCLKFSKTKNCIENINSSKESVSHTKNEVAPIAQTECFDDEQMQTSTDSISEDMTKSKKYKTNKLLEEAQPLLINENVEQIKVEDYDSGNEHDDDSTLIIESNISAKCYFKDKKIAENKLDDILKKSDKLLNLDETFLVQTPDLKNNFSNCAKSPHKIQQVSTSVLNHIITLDNNCDYIPSSEIEILQKDNSCNKPLHVETEFADSLSSIEENEMKIMNGEITKASKIESNYYAKLPKEKNEKDEINCGDVLSPTGSLNKGTFLIDDDYTDQPALITNGHFPQHIEERPPSSQSDKDEDAGFLDRSDDTQSRSDSYSARRTPMLGKISMGKSNDTLSPFSSLDSEDLMLDFEKSLEEDYVEHCVDRNYDQPAEGAGEITFQAEDRTSPDGEIDRPVDVRPIQTSSTFLEWASLINNHQTHSRLKPHDRNIRIRSVSSPESANPPDFRPRSLTAFKPPKQICAVEEEDGGVTIDGSSYRYFLQDLTALKTMLHKLKRVLHEAETVNPFEANLSLKNGLYKVLASSESPNFLLKSYEIDREFNSEDIIQQNADLKRQVVFLQQKLEGQDHTIKLLQQQMATYNQIPECEEKDFSNAATQTDKPRLFGGSNMSRSPSVEDAGSCSIRCRTELSFRFGKIYEF